MPFPGLIYTSSPIVFLLALGSLQGNPTLLSFVGLSSFIVKDLLLQRRHETCRKGADEKMGEKDDMFQLQLHAVDGRDAPVAKTSSGV